MLEITFARFTWYRPASAKTGFAWRAVGNALILNEVPGASFVSYQPAEHPALFRNFAELRTDKDILRFANRFGNLVSGKWAVSTFDLKDWQKRSAEMRAFVALVDFLHDDAYKTADLLGNKDAILHHAKDASRRTQARAQDLRTADDVAAVAATPILWRFKKLLEEVDATVTWDGVARRPRLSIVPVTLGDFLYWQLTQSFFRGMRFTQCITCGTWFEPRRPDCARFCQRACRFKHYRLQQRRAWDLAVQGWSAAKIARELGSQTAVVKTWLLNSPTAKK